MHQNSLRISIRKDDPLLIPLPMGGTNPQGIKIEANQRFLIRNNQPWLPIMGEFHFSRVPRDIWKEELLKAKAGGLTVIAAYVLWNHIEEQEGVFDWSGNHDLRAFIQICQQVGLSAFPRIGPWAHGECRNGGFPDWLLEKCGTQVRTDAPLYLSYARRFYQEISLQIQGLLWKDGGPIIGVQIENELLNNAAHIQTLKSMAQEVGIEVPLYTMTGWGPAEVPTSGEVIPVFGGYPDAFWDRQVSDWSRPSRKHYFFSSLRDDNTIGADLNPESTVGDLAYLNRFPYGTCELGGGMQAAYHRRPIIQPQDVSALATVKIGNGSNLQGYYMYQGGANPMGKFSTLQESQSTGYANDLPVIQYDYQAPLGQYGQLHANYHQLRRLHLFLNDERTLLANLPPFFPENYPTDLDDRQTVRWAVRSDGQRGYLFLNNYQREEPLPAHSDVQFQVTLPTEEIQIPDQPVTIPSGCFAIWPFNFEVGGLRIKYATAQFLSSITLPEGPWLFFFAAEGIEPQFVFEAQSIEQIETPGSLEKINDRYRVAHLKPATDCVIKIKTKQGGSVNIVVLSAAQSLHFWKGSVWGQDRLFLSKHGLCFDSDQIHLETSASQAGFSVFPAPQQPLCVGKTELSGAEDGVFTRFEIPAPHQDIPLTIQRVKKSESTWKPQIGPAGVAQAPEDQDFQDAETWQILFQGKPLEGVHELLVQINYIGDVARAYVGDQMIDDDFYNGLTWEIGIRRFAPAILEKGLTLRILPLCKDAPIYLSPQSRPTAPDQDKFLLVESISATPVYRFTVTQG